MGVKGLLPLLRDIAHSTHISQYKGKQVAIDASSWLYRGAFTCARELCLGEKADGHITWVMRQVAVLLKEGVIPVFVFDGQHVSSKASTNAKRRSEREKFLQDALAAEAAGDQKKAMRFYGKALCIRSSWITELIERLRAERISFVVAPYEADAQLAWLCINGIVSAVITEDSDLLCYGTPEVLLKLDAKGYCDAVRFSDVGGAVRLGDCGPSGWTLPKFQLLCSLIGCDYTDNLPGLGPSNACALVRKGQTFAGVIRQLLSSRFASQCNDAYFCMLLRSQLIFRYHRVYNTKARRIVHLRPACPHDPLLNATCIALIKQNTDQPSTLTKLRSTAMRWCSNVRVRPDSFCGYCRSPETQLDTPDPQNPFPSGGAGHGLQKVMDSPLFDFLGLPLRCRKLIRNLVFGNVNPKTYRWYKDSDSPNGTEHPKTAETKQMPPEQEGSAEAKQAVSSELKGMASQTSTVSADLSRKARKRAGLRFQKPTERRPRIRIGNAPAQNDNPSRPHPQIRIGSAASGSDDPNERRMGSTRSESDGPSESRPRIRIGNTTSESRKRPRAPSESSTPARNGRRALPAKLHASLQSRHKKRCVGLACLCPLPPWLDSWGPFPF